MDLDERVAAAIFNAPDPADPDAPFDPWPPSRPDDVAWWLTRAQAAINAIKGDVMELNGTAAQLLRAEDLLVRDAEFEAAWKVWHALQSTGKFGDGEILRAALDAARVVRKES